MQTDFQGARKSPFFFAAIGFDGGGSMLVIWNGNRSTSHYQKDDEARCRQVSFHVRSMPAAGIALIDLFHILPGSKSEFCPMMLGLVDDVPLDLLKLTCGQSEKTAVIMKLRPPPVRDRRDLRPTTG